MDRTYEAPQIESIGDVADLTKQGNNKIGQGTDMFTSLTGLIGSIVPAQP